MDRFTRFQELTRFMAESVNDVATLQRSLQRTLQSAEDELAAQARLTRELQDDLLRTRMVEFESLADRLYRCVRQAAKDTGKQVRLDIVGGGIEIDRGVLERMVGSFEHLLRNSVAHGVESPAERGRAARTSRHHHVTVAQSGNEVAWSSPTTAPAWTCAHPRRAVERGLLAADETRGDDELAAADLRARLLHRRSGDRDWPAAASAWTWCAPRSTPWAAASRPPAKPGRGTRFRLLLPLTTAVTQVVMLRCGRHQWPCLRR
jgi:chemosensory pili system protein ChpA (sensor histidine kinase/response regulator)